MSLLNLSLLATLATMPDTASPDEMDTLVDGAGFVRVVRLDLPDLRPVTIPRTMLPPDLSMVSTRGAFTPSPGVGRRQQRATLDHGDKLFLQSMSRAKFARKGPKNTSRRRRLAALFATN